MSPSYPKQSPARQISREAEKLFEQCLDTASFLEHRIPLEYDYGLDYRIETIHAGELRGHEFYVQLKGTSMPIQDDMISVSIDSRTIMYWKQKLAPVMLVLADVASRRCYFQWFDKSTDIPKDRKQVTFHVLRENEWATCRVLLSLRPYYEEWRTQLNDKPMRSYFFRLFCDASDMLVLLNYSMGDILNATSENQSEVKDRSRSLILMALVNFIRQSFLARESVDITPSQQLKQIDSSIIYLKRCLDEVYAHVGDVSKGFSVGLSNDEKMFLLLPIISRVIGEIVTFLRPFVVGESALNNKVIRPQMFGEMNVDNFLSDFKHASSSFFKRQDIFVCPVTTQLLLIDTLFSFFKPHGFGRSELPLITEQYGDPPLFCELRREGNSDPYQFPPEIINIEQVLGVYVAQNEQITLFADGIRWFASKLNVPEGLLRFVVLVHEIAHWMVHRLPTEAADEFPLEFYEASEEQFHETLAQLLTHWVSKAIHPTFGDVFLKLNSCQSPIYRLYQHYEETPCVAVVMSIVDARLRTCPSTYQQLSDDILKRESQLNDKASRS